MIYFTSDLHFGHTNVIKYTNRPYANVEEMTEKLIENWNRKIQPKDEVYILGDFTMRGATYAEEILGQLKGRKYLIRGNHDYFVDDNKFRDYVGMIEWVEDYHMLKYQNHRLILCHYPFLEWNYCHHASIHLHGHQHNKPEYNLANREAGIFRYDVGVDANNYAPVALDDILEFFSNVECRMEHEHQKDDL